MIEKNPLSEVSAAYEKMHSGKASFHLVLTMGN
jgi:D-arabinose 1-dehydrogenase-like Zn-dependent alcohol dehydrogenase